jgi:predicted nucleic acid-binding protein
MLDVVVDTNIFMHAANPSEDRFEDANCLLNKIYGNQTFLCIDEGFDFDESKNSSHIGHEFIKNLHQGSFGFSLIVFLASNCRLKFLAKRSSVAVSKKINQLVSKKSDRVFLNVAANSIAKCLVSHDFEDFQTNKRKTIKKDIGIDVLDAQCCADKM